MRHTLLPLADRIHLRKEYRIRVIVVFCFTFCLVLLLGIAALFPTFIKVVSVEKQTKNLMANNNNSTDSVELKAIQQSVSKSLLLIDSIRKEKVTPNISNLVNGVIDLRGDLKFYGFSATKVSSTTFTMNIQGFAPTRNSLISFRERFEKMGNGNKVELPVSELAKSSNIVFSLQLKQRMP